METYLVWFFGLMAGIGAGIGLGSWMVRSTMKKRLFELGELKYSNDGRTVLWKDGSKF